ncbi:MAG: hypothetical protein IKY72_07365 [Bacteroidaceae bacterium]|nr:hypothetical protein [Bacteroidaceae bacterium]
MNIQLTFNEILGYVENKFHIRPTIDVVDRKTLRIMYKISRLMPAISVNVHVDSVSKELIRLTYDCSSIINCLLKGLIKIPRHQVEVHTNEHQVLVHLDTFEELVKVLAVVEPTDITFSNNAVNIMLSL